MTDSKTQQAVELMRLHPGMTAYEAAKRIGVDVAAVYRAINKTKKRCPTCGNIVKDAK